MSQVTVRYTHKGWFGVCPVWVSNPNQSVPTIEPRHWMLTPLMALSEAALSLYYGVKESLGFQSNGWPVLITGELEEPIVVMAEDGA